jgi:hypothetical protein
MSNDKGALYLFNHRYDPGVNTIQAMEQAAAMGLPIAIHEMAASTMFSDGISFKRRFPFFKQSVLVLHERHCIVSLDADAEDALDEGDFSLIYDFSHFISTHLPENLPRDDEPGFEDLREVLLHYTESQQEAKAAVFAWCWCARYHLGFYPDLIRLVGEYIWAERKTWLQ